MGLLFGGADMAAAVASGSAQRPVVTAPIPSNVGQMLNRYCIEQQIPLVNIVRKPDQEVMLRAAGAVHVCNSTSAGFMAELIDALAATGAGLAFDAIGGGQLASHIPTGMEAAAGAAAGGYSRYGSAVHTQVYIYGSL
jgi:NADPH:quinone reductase